LHSFRLAEAYAHHLSGPTPNPYLAWERLGQIIRALTPTQAFDLACHHIRTLPKSYLPTFGGGALTHLVDYHGAAPIDWTEREASRTSTFGRHWGARGGRAKAFTQPC
jgi:hypothetical protein